MDNLAKVTKPKAQPSRKGKRAWRRNIDVEDINESLDAKRDREILHGEDDRDEFVIDTKGSTSKGPTAKKLKMTEILTNKSKVEPIRSRSVKKRVSGSKVKELMALGGRLITDEKHQKRLEKEGLVKGANVDVWGEDDEVALPDELKKSAYLSITKPSKVPKTAQQGPIALTLHKSKGSVENDVDAGKSYNPSLELWQALIDKEFDAESSMEMQRQAMAEHEKRIQFLIENMKEDVLESEDEETKPQEEEEDVPEEEKYKLSLNAPAKWKKKTKTQRNKMERNAKMRELETKLHDLRVRMKELQRLEDIEKEVETKQEASKNKAPKQKKHRRHGRNEVIFKPLEVKLSDELSGNLKNVKPEGNPFYDQMHRLQASGKIEALGLRRKRRYAPKIVEKHSYRHYK
ncbi:hypothetical protein C7M61_002247 [Candidozyma pseudohaemuli]|uniref:Ribosome biogenesis protein NOP53 n=1 Tax=Candidozyma pseudohaemuli TaxID=418784 RepID=A0A2P7YSJ8_9ASCO|nr:hypothetical protein C7M61_002247 [[Candida] pseudohaemulonii]PSK38941.1 hypothetical protein C7M61_002247 [[Candida] pseudohaemulonii]